MAIADKVDEEDRLLDHYSLLAISRSNAYNDDLSVARSFIDCAPGMQALLGRTDGGYGYLRALIIAGIATYEERCALSEYAG